MTDQQKQALTEVVISLSDAMQVAGYGIRFGRLLALARYSKLGTLQDELMPYSNDDIDALSKAAGVLSNSINNEIRKRQFDAGDSASGKGHDGSDPESDH